MDKAIIKQEFKRRKNNRLIVAILLIPILFGTVFMSIFEIDTFLGIPIEYIEIGGIVLLIGALLFSFFNWRCPSCNGYLGKIFNPVYCTNCGAELK